MAEVETLDRGWLARNPLPDLPTKLDKNARGRVLIIGGSQTVPGGVCLTADAAFRAGAGKVQLALPAALAVPVGLSIPEAGVLALDGDDRDSELIEGALAEADSVVVGPAMTSRNEAARLLSLVCMKARKTTGVVVDALAFEACDSVPVWSRESMVFTPNSGEVASMLDQDVNSVEADQYLALKELVAKVGGVVSLKGEQTLIGAPNEPVLLYKGGGPGLAVSGSGDVLAGLIGGLLARGAAARVATAWGVWLHGESGRSEAASSGPIGFLARDLAAHVPLLMAEATSAEAAY